MHCNADSAASGSDHEWKHLNEDNFICYLKWYLPFVFQSFNFVLIEFLIEKQGGRSHQQVRPTCFWLQMRELFREISCSEIKIKTEIQVGFTLIANWKIMQHRCRVSKFSNSCFGRAVVCHKVKKYGFTFDLWFKDWERNLSEIVILLIFEEFTILATNGGYKYEFDYNYDVEPHNLQTKRLP